MSPNLREEVVEGYEAFQAKIKELKTNHPKEDIVVMFTGNDGADGKSWCPDCVARKLLLCTVKRNG
jgi:hypothetical protein